MFGCDCVGPNCNVVSRWPKCIHIPWDVLGMNWLQVTASGLECSDHVVHEAVSVGQVFRHVGH